MQYRIIRETMSLLLAVACLKVKRRNGGWCRDMRDGPQVPQHEEAKCQHTERCHCNCTRLPPRRSCPQTLHEALPERPAWRLFLTRCPGQKLIDRVLRGLTSLAEIASDDLERQVLLDMHRRSLEPGGKVAALIGREARAARHEPVCR